MESFRTMREEFLGGAQAIRLTTLSLLSDMALTLLQVIVMILLVLVDNAYDHVGACIGA